jgi:hypothetical protein
LQSSKRPNSVPKEENSISKPIGVNEPVNQNQAGFQNFEQKIMKNMKDFEQKISQKMEQNAKDQQ